MTGAVIKSPVFVSYRESTSYEIKSPSCEQCLGKNT